jgi:hypothetical protein
VCASARPTDNRNRKLVKHLNNESEALFTFLDDPAVPATNHHAERAIRPAVITRKTCGGGNREWSGARATSILLTILRTAWQQDRDPTPILADILCQPIPAVAHVLLPPHSRPPSPAGISCRDSPPAHPAP